MFRPLCRQAAQRLGRNERANAVVQTTGDDAAVGVLFDPAVQHARVADTHAVHGFIVAGGANVDPQVDHLGDPVEILLFQLMHRLLAYHAVHGPVPGEQQHALPHENLGIPPSDAAEIEKTFLVDVCDLQADLVDMACEHHAGFALGVERRHGIAMNIGAHIVGKRGDFVTPHPCRRLLEPRGPRRIEQLLEKSDGLDGHAVVWDVVLVSL